MPVHKAIVIPLADHATEAEVRDIMEDLQAMQFAHDPVFNPQLPTASWLDGYTLASLGNVEWE